MIKLWLTWKNFSSWVKVWLSITKFHAVTHKCHILLTLCNISIKTSSLLMNCCYGLSVDLWEAWGFVGLKKPGRCFILSSIPFIACSIFLECLCSKFVLIGEKDQCKNEDLGCVSDDIEGLLFKKHVLLSSTLFMLFLESLPILSENQQLVLLRVFWSSEDCRLYERVCFQFLGIAMAH